MQIHRLFGSKPIRTGDGPSFAACSGLVFNHESPLSGTEFVTRKFAFRLACNREGERNCGVDDANA